VRKARLASAEDRIAAGSSSASTSSWLPRLAALVAAHPLRERLAGSTSPRSIGPAAAEALTSYEEAREAAGRRELARPVTASLQAIHVAALRGELAESTGAAGHRASGICAPS